MPHHRRGPLIALVAALLVAGAGVARADRLPRVAVVVLLEVNVAPEQTDALTAALGDAIRTRLEADVIAGREVRRRMPPSSVSAGCAAEAACLADLGRRLEADTLLLVVAAAVGDEVQLDITWANPATGETLAREALVTGTGDTAALFEAAAPRLLPELPARRARPQPWTDEPPPPTTTRRGRHLTVGSGVSGGVAIAALAGGVGLALAARAENADLEADPCAVTRTCDAGDLRLYSAGADILFGTALVAGAVAAWLYVGSADDEPPVRAAFTGDGAAIVFGARF